MIERTLEQQIAKAKHSILLLGPRQTGKTTLLKSLEPDLTINLSREREYQDHLSDVGLIEDLIARSKPKVVFIDEIQRIPNLLNTVQALIDERKCRFLITGSSARKLKRGEANLLPGRIINKRIFPVTLAELDFKIDTSEALKYGFLPGILSLGDEAEKQDLLSSYVSNYLREEIQQEALTRNLAGYARFMNVLPEWAGRVLDYSKLATKNKLNRFAVHRFFEIFEDTLLGERIAGSDFFDETSASKHPKFYFFDNGVQNGIAPAFVLRDDSLGIACETIVFNQLKAHFAYAGKPISLTYFRSHTGVEIDFILKVGSLVSAIEVKANDRLGSDDVRHLKWAKSQKPKIHPYLIHFGARSRRVDGIWCLNWLEGLRELTQMA